MRTYRILVVEDDPNIQQIYTFKLEMSGFEVKAANNGMIGLQLAESFNPDLLLIDLHMPQLDGAGMLEKLRASTWGASMRVMILTNISKDEAPKQLRFLNVDRYIMKVHHTPQQVVDIVQEVLSID